MILPKLPTDNLYKFISLFGLTLVISYTFMNYKNNIDLQNEIANLTYETDLNTYEIEKADKERKKWIDNIAELCETKPCDCKITERTDYSIKVTFSGKPCNSQAIVDEINTLQSFISVDLDKLKSKIETTKAKQNLINRKKDNFNNQKIELLGLLIIGFFMTFLGFYLWYIKVQKHQDIIIKRQASEINLKEKLIKKTEKEVQTQKNEM